MNYSLINGKERKTKTMKMKFKESETIFEGSVKKIAQNLLNVQTDAKAADVTKGLIEVLTEEGSVIAKYEGFTTVYDTTEDGFVLSDNETVKPEPQPDVVDIEQIRSSKLAEVSRRCEDTIYAGTEVTLTDGSEEHISLTEKDQINLFGKQAQLAAGAAKLEYHEDGKLCRFYDAADMQQIIQTAMQFVSFHTTYCNSLNVWIKAETDADVIKAINYGDEVPDAYKSEVLAAYEAQNA